VAAWLVSRGSRRRYAIATAATVATVVLGVFSQRPIDPPANPRLHVLDVAHGSMALLEKTDGQTCLIDAGTLGGKDCYQQVLRPFLRAMRLRNPHEAFISHADWDHYSALPSMAVRHRPDRLYLTEYFARDTDTPGSRALVRSCEQLGTQVVRVHRPACLALGQPGSVASDPCEIQVLWPPPPADLAGLGLLRAGFARDLSTNDSSMVLRLCANGQAVILPGDIAPLAEAELTREALAAAQSKPVSPNLQTQPAVLPTSEFLRAAVLVLPHHGSATPTLKAFIEVTGAKILVQSNTRRQAAPALLDAIGKRKRYATFREGWICVELTKQGPVITTMRTLAD
jgi:beta-lactamase superfamily II metal-dependent hydrolase